MKVQPVVLIILDGWGIRPEPLGNAITEADPVHYFDLIKRYPNIAIEASGEPVGLPDGQMGNSEVGHLNIGAGRVVYQELTRIDKAIRDGDFFQNPVLLESMAAAKRNNKTLHLMGLVSDGGVHSSVNHLLALLDMAKQNGVEKVRVHAFLDGRDVPPQSAGKSLEVVEQKLLDLDYPQIATITGRYFAMDRDKRWDRVQKAYENLVMANGRRSLLSKDALQLSYNQDETDEFITPSVTDLTYEGMEDGDSVLFFNFRPDRAREITVAITQPDFTGFERQKILKNIHFTCMCMYDETLTLPIAYTKQPLHNLLVNVLSENGIKQFRTAETEKYAHVTYFFNGGFEATYPGEERFLVNSPKVATYDLQPEMSLKPVTDAVVNALDSGTYQFIAANFANPDMVGHTGKLDAAILAVKAIDEAIWRVAETALKNNWVMLLTADHGNIETMIDTDGGPHTAHTTRQVPLLMVSNDKSVTLKNDQTYALCNIAPSILDLMGLPIPAEMSPSILQKALAPSA